MLAIFLISISLHNDIVMQISLDIKALSLKSDLIQDYISGRVFELGVRRWDEDVLKITREAMRELELSPRNLGSLIHVILEDDPLNPSRLLKPLRKRVETIAKLKTNHGTKRVETYLDREDYMRWVKDFDMVESMIKVVRRDIFRNVQAIILEELGTTNADVGEES
jgi:ATP-dependent Lon protease